MTASGKRRVSSRTGCFVPFGAFIGISSATENRCLWGKRQKRLRLLFPARENTMLVTKLHAVNQFVVATLKDFRSAVRTAAMAAVGVLTFVPSAVPAPAAIEIAPHRAIYKMSLSTARSGSTVSDVRDQMMFEWSDACDGWTIEQRFQLRFLYTEGEQVDMSTNYATWEAKDGHSYRFNVRKLVNGEVDEELRGTAESHDDRPGIAHYLKPEAQEIELPGGTMFPTMHT